MMILTPPTETTNSIQQPADADRMASETTNLLAIAWPPLTGRQRLMRSGPLMLHT
jgi:hypothetical protein